MNRNHDPKKLCEEGGTREDWGGGGEGTWKVEEMHVKASASGATLTKGPRSKAADVERQKRNETFGRDYVPRCCMKKREKNPSKTTSRKNLEGLGRRVEGGQDQLKCLRRQCYTSSVKEKNPKQCKTARSEQKKIKTKGTCDPITGTGAIQSKVKSQDNNV